MKVKPAKAVRDLAKDHIEHYPLLKWLQRCRIEYFFILPSIDREGNEKPPQRKGREILGTAKVVSGLGALFCNGSIDYDAVPNLETPPRPFYVLLISEMTWQRIKSEFKATLVYHYLCHFGRNDAGEPMIEDPDFAGYLSEIAEFGPWREDLEKAFDMGRNRQLGLFSDDEELDSDDGDAEFPEEDEERESAGVSAVTLSFGDKSVTLTGDH